LAHASSLSFVCLRWWKKSLSKDIRRVLFLFPLFHIALLSSSLLLLEEQCGTACECFRLSSDCTALAERWVVFVVCLEVPWGARSICGWLNERVGWGVFIHFERSPIRTNTVDGWGCGGLTLFCSVNLRKGLTSHVPPFSEFGKWYCFFANEHYGFLYFFMRTKLRQQFPKFSLCCFLYNLLKRYGKNWWHVFLR
jgi:hypothetical protein